MHNKPVRPGRCHVANRCRIYEIFPAYRPFGPEYFFLIIRFCFPGRGSPDTAAGYSKKAVTFLQLLLRICPFGWWEQRESNPRPSACKADALNQLSYAPFSCFFLAITASGGASSVSHLRK